MYIPFASLFILRNDEVDARWQITLRYVISGRKNEFYFLTYRWSRDAGTSLCNGSH